MYPFPSWMGQIRGFTVNFNMTVNMMAVLQQVIMAISISRLSLGYSIGKLLLVKVLKVKFQ